MLKGHNVTGMTLIELLICLAIFSIVWFFSLPSSSELTDRNQIECVKNDIESALQYAKMQSMLRNETLLIMSLPNEQNWSHGIAVFSGADLSNLKPLHMWPWHFKNIQVLWKGFQSRNYLRFATGINHYATNGHFLIQGQYSAVKLVINRFARLRVDRQ